MALRGLLRILITLVVVSVAAHAQHTTVSATVLDPAGQPYTNCDGGASFVNLNTTPGSGPPLLNGGTFETTVPIQCDSSAYFSVSLADNNVISPGPSEWRFSICAPVNLSNGPPPICFSAQLTITGATQDISAALQLAAVVLPTQGGGNRLQVNGASLPSSHTANFNDTTPAATTNGLNLVFQTSTLGFFDSISAEIVGDGDPSHCLNGTGAWAGCGAGAAPAGSDTYLQIKSGAGFDSVPNVAPGSVLASAGTGTKPAFQTKNVIDVRDYGVACNGSTDDTTAMNNALAAAVAIGTSTGTAHVKIPAGVCVGNFTILQGKGLKIEGSGELSTHFRSPNANPALQINGLWYSSFSDMTFEIFNHNTTGGVVEIDGNYDGTHHQTVQFLTFTNVLFAGLGVSDGQLSLYTVAVCRQSSGACQGSNLTFINNAFSGASSAVYVQNGFNALSNQFIGGDFQVYTKNGMYVNGGGVQVLGTTFETGYQCAQVLNGGYDINTVGGNLQSNLVYGVRSEGWQLVSGTSSAPLSIDGLTQNSSWTTYASNHAFVLNTAVKQTGTDSKAHLYCATVAGTTDVSPPTWPASGSVSDGGVTWTEEDYNAVSLGAGNSGYFNQADSSVDSSARIATQNWYFPLGTTTGTSGGATIAYQLSVGSNASAEHFMNSQGNFVDIYVNPNTTSTSAYSGISLPGTSSGILTKTGNLYLGTALYQSHGDSLYHLSSQLQSTVATGTAPFTIASTTNVANLNASSLGGATFAAPGAIGGGTPNTGAFTILTGTTFNTTTNCAASGSAANPSVVSCVAAAAGAVACDVAASGGTCTINTTAVTANSQIFVQEVTDEGTRLTVTCNTSPTLVPAITLAAKVAATSFTINMPTITTDPACFDYFIVN